MSAQLTRKEEIIIRLCRSEDFDGELSFEILFDQEKATKHPYVVLKCIFPYGFTDNKLVFLTNISAYHFGFPIEDRRNCAVWIRKVFGIDHPLALGTFLNDDPIAQSIFYPEQYKLWEEVIVARVREHHLVG